jgi:hypothetical protein
VAEELQALGRETTALVEYARQPHCALHVQHFHDPVTLAAVNEIETLTTGLSAKIWQKITLLDRAAPP